MKIIIKESQHNFLLEQSDYIMDKRANVIANVAGIRSDKDYQKIDKSIDKAHQGKAIDAHTLMTVLAIGTAFIPVAGPFISAAISLGDAALYYNEGDKKSAGLTAAFSMIPFIGKIPGVKELGSKGMSLLASKISKGVKTFSPAEIKVLNAVKQNESIIKQGLTNASNKISPITKEIQSFKPAYIKRYGQESYDNLLRNYISGTSDKNYFIQTLKSSKKANPKLANFATKFGIKLTQDELTIIKRISDGVIANKPSQIMLVNTNKGLKKITVTVLDSKQISKFAPTDTIGLASGDQIVLNKDLMKNYNSQKLQELIGHELAHIKDPAMVSSKLKSTYNINSLKNYNLHPLEVNAVKSASLQNLTTTTKDWMKYLPKDQLIGYLDDIIRYTKGQKIFDPNSLKMIGQDGLDQLVLYYKNDKKIYRSVLTKLAQQAEYLKSQVNIAM
jgi:hypothetical protein